jgi:type II secretory ATPase GspE/PulE/Tfp pilus assembly ATPase PilB-like protein
MLYDENKKLPLNIIRREQEEKRAEERSQQEGFSYVNLTSTPIDREAITMITEDESRQAKVAIVQKVGRRLEVVVFSAELPATAAFLDKLREQGYDLDIFIVSDSSLKKAWQIYATYVAPKQSLKGTFKLDPAMIKDLKQGIKDIGNLKEKILSPSTSEVLNIIIAGAYFGKASDIHFEPQANEVKLRYRVDGVLHDVVEIKRSDYEHILSRIKILSGLKINIHDTNQDGRFSFDIPEEDGEVRKVDVRVSILPEADGETIVMRILGTGAVGLSIESLGIRDIMFGNVKRALEEPNGLILTTGPTGSGKTTTLYSFIKHINNPEVKIITAEDPIEYQIKGVTQSQINAEEGYDFSHALRAIVRQDPDIILVGEIRDRETADMAIQASLTGHLVFSTLHTNDAAGAIPRLRDLGTDEKSVTSALKLVIAQRLVRKLCDRCKEEHVPTDEERKNIEKNLEDIKDREKYPSIGKVCQAKGCEECFGLGYNGRIGIFEIFTINSEIEALVLSRATNSDILVLLKKQGFITMKQDGYLKILEGITSIDEVERVT